MQQREFLQRMITPPTGHYLLIIIIIIIIIITITIIITIIIIITFIYTAQIQLCLQFSNAAPHNKRTVYSKYIKYNIWSKFDTGVNITGIQKYNNR